MTKRTSKSDGGIGPGNPPRTTQFQKGTSGNPGGRPKIERDFAKLVDKILDETVIGEADGKRIKMTKRQYLASKLVAEAAKGNLKAIDRIIDLGSKSGSSDNKLIEIEPAVLASFLARYGGGASGKDDGGADGGASA